jgi:hypothetical protein
VYLLKILVDILFYNHFLLIIFLFFIVQMEAVYIPEEDHCTDILSLVEDEDNLKYFIITKKSFLKLLFEYLVFVRIH